MFRAVQSGVLCLESEEMAEILLLPPLPLLRRQRYVWHKRSTLLVIVFKLSVRSVLCSVTDVL